MSILIVIIAALAICFGHTSAAQLEKITKCNVTSGKYERLPTFANPVNYNLLINPYLVNHTFTGEVSIRLNIVNQTNQLIFNAFRIDINHANLVNNGKG